MTRIAAPQLEPFYTAAARFVDAALRNDDSLFTPGVPIWSRAHLDMLHHDYVEQPDASSGTFLDKLRGQLAHADPATIQLMAEVLYVHWLPANGIRPDTKRNQINTLLGWSSAPVSMPAALDEAHAATAQLRGCPPARTRQLLRAGSSARLWPDSGSGVKCR